MRVVVIVKLLFENEKYLEDPLFFGDGNSVCF